MSVPEAKRRVKPAEERRQEILDSALRLFREHGFDEVTVQDVADEAGVATGTVYLYFPSKERLLHAIHVRFDQGLEARFAEEAVRLGERLQAGEELDHRSVIDATFDALMAYNVEHRAALEVMCRYFPRLGSFDEAKDFERSHARFLADAFRRGVEAGFIHSDDPDLTAYLLGAINIALGEALAFGEPADLDGLLAEAKKLYYRALAPPD
jgi:AcrR family transcriptional regulator